MLSIVDNYRAVEKKVSNQLLQDIAQASLHTDFISESPHFFIHVDHSFIEIHIRKDTFSNDHILRNTALDTGILIHAIRSLIIELGHEPITDYEMLERGTVRVARISLGISFTDEMRHQLNRTKKIMYGVSRDMQSQNKEEAIKHELQRILIERQLYVQQNNSNKTQANDAKLVVLGAYFHLGGWIEVGMSIGNAIEHVNKTLNTKIHICCSSKCSHVVSEKERNRGRFVLLGFTTENLDYKIPTREIQDYFV